MIAAEAMIAAIMGLLTTGDEFKVSMRSGERYESLWYECIEPQDPFGAFLRCRRVDVVEREQMSVSAELVPIESLWRREFVWIMRLDIEDISIIQVKPR